MIIKKLLATSILLVVTLVATSAQTERAPQRITFARGATQARAKGYLRGIRDRASFVLRLGAGQHVRVEIDAPGSTRGVLTWPSGKQDGGPGGVIYDGDIDETGDYKISVGESLMGEQWRGSFTVIVEALPRGQSAPDTSNLESYVGKYPSELFQRMPAVKTRLRQLLGTSYQAFMDRMQVEVPFEKQDDVLITTGCMAHSCTIEESILAIDLNDGRPYVALRMNSRISRTFPADRTKLPEALKRAMESH